MFKEEVIHLSDEEVKLIAGVDEIDFAHERNQPTPTGIKAVFKDYLDEKRQPIKREVVNARVLQHLRTKSIIGPERWVIRLSPSHSWSNWNSDGRAHSVYRLNYTLSRNVSFEV